MAYEFKTLGSVEALTAVPENANALVEVDGAIKRVPGGALGGSSGGGEIFVLHKHPEYDEWWFDEGASEKIINAFAQGGCPQIMIKCTDDSGHYLLEPAGYIEFYHGSAHGDSRDSLTIGSWHYQNTNFFFEDGNFVYNAS